MSIAQCAILFPLVFLQGCSSEAKLTLKFSAIPNIDAKLLKFEYQPVATFLSEKLGIPVEYVPAADYQASVAMFVNDEIQFAWFGGLTGVQARDRVKGANAIAKGQMDANYKTYFIAPKGTPLTTSDKFPMAAKDKRLTFGNKGSTSGRLMPEFFIRKNTDLAPNDFFAEVGFSGSHSNTIKQVVDGGWDLGAVDFAEYEDHIAKGELKAEDCPIIWETPTYADYNFTTRPDLDEKYGAGFTERLTKALLKLDEEMCARFRRKKMIPAANSDFQGIVDVARQLDLLR